MPHPHHGIKTKRQPRWCEKALWWTMIQPSHNFRFWNAKIYLKKLLSFKATEVPYGVPRKWRGTRLSVPLAARLDSSSQPDFSVGKTSGDSSPSTFPTRSSLIPTLLPSLLTGFNRSLRTVIPHQLQVTWKSCGFAAPSHFTGLFCLY